MKLNRGQFNTASRLMRERKYGTPVPPIVFLLLKWWGHPRVIDFQDFKRIRSAKIRWGLPWR